MYQNERGEIVYTKEEEQFLRLEEINLKLRGYVSDNWIILINEYLRQQTLGLDTNAAELAHQHGLIWGNLPTYEEDELSQKMKLISGQHISAENEKKEEITEETPLIPNIADMLKENKLNFKQKRK